MGKPCTEDGYDFIRKSGKAPYLAEPETGRIMECAFKDLVPYIPALAPGDGNATGAKGDEVPDPPVPLGIEGRRNLKAEAVSAAYLLTRLPKLDARGLPLCQGRQAAVYTAAQEGS